MVTSTEYTDLYPNLIAEDRAKSSKLYGLVFFLPNGKPNPKVLRQIDSTALLDYTQKKEVINAINDVSNDLTKQINTVTNKLNSQVNNVSKDSLSLVAISPLVATKNNELNTMLMNRLQYNEVLLIKKQYGDNEAIWLKSKAKAPSPEHKKHINKRFKVAKGLWDNVFKKYFIPAERYNCQCGMRIIL